MAGTASRRLLGVVGAWVFVLGMLVDALGPDLASTQEPSNDPGGAEAQAAAASAPSEPIGSSPAPASDADPGSSPAPPDEPTESAQELIAKALKAGRIDYPTSLVYRGYAFWGDDRLPPDLWGSGSQGEDMALTIEIEALGEDAPADLRDELHSLVVRPTDPDSIANRQMQDAEAVASLSGAILPDSLLRCPRTFGWHGVRVVDRGINLKVWATCDGNERDDVAKAIAFARTIWAPMVQHMGAPIPDDGTDGDDANDVYLLQPGGLARFRWIPGDAHAVTVPADPRIGRRSSGFILMPRSGIGTEVWKQLLIHEFFHLLQLRHNQGVMHRWVGGSHEVWWFTEASATWAETYFGRSRSLLTHQRWLSPFQGTASRTSLHVSEPSLHMYHAYVWPLFMEQEQGFGVIAQAWSRVEGVAPGDFDRADKVLDGLVSFRARFRDFAVRMLNKELPGDPIAPRLQKVDDHTPLDVTPPVENRTSLPPVKIEELGHTITERLPALTATYIRIDPHGDARQVTLDFRKLLPADALDVDILVKTLGQDWVRRRVQPGERVRYCFNRKDQDVFNMYVILSNHALDKGTTITGSFRVRPLFEPCGTYDITGTWKVRSGGGGVLTDTDFSASYDFSWDPGYDPGKPGTGSFRSSIATGTPPLPCNPGVFDEYRGRLVPTATSKDDRVMFVLMPVHRPGTPPFVDVFNTLFVVPYMGSRWVDVPLEGAGYRFKEGNLPMDMICDGRGPKGGGRATVVRVKDT